MRKVTPRTTNTAFEQPLVIRGGTPLKGELRVLSAKNSALKLVAASLLTAEPVTLLEAPRIRDIEVMLELLSHLGTRYAWEGPKLHLHTPEITNTVQTGQVLLLPLKTAESGEPTAPNVIEPPPLKKVAFTSKIRAKEQPRYYTVKRGDTLSSVARRFDVGLSDLKTWNPKLGRPYELQAGNRIVVSVN